MQNKTMLKRTDQKTKNILLRSGQMNEKRNQGFRIFSLGKDEADITVENLSEINFEDVKRRLDRGESVFIGVIQKKLSEPKVFTDPKEDSWFFSRR